MKMKDKDYHQLVDALDKLDSNTPGGLDALAQTYRDSGLSYKRFRWDILHASKLRAGQSVGTPTGWNVYDYLNDDHIDTALQKYCRHNLLTRPDWN